MLTLFTEFAPPTPDADEARRQAEEELSRGIYTDGPSLLERFFMWLQELLTGHMGGIGSTRWIYTVFAWVVVIAIAVIVVWLLVRFRRRRRQYAQDSSEVFTSESSSDDLLESAQQALREGMFDLALVERFRWMVRSCDERRIIRVYPGLTACDAAQRIAQFLPDLRGEIIDAAHLFDSVRYGQITASENDEQQMTRLTEHVVTVLSSPSEVKA
ncbi:DUF4129 domain-containing protein [Actinomyces vulturis]|uniref:DUF4129 domain-containing protein n=1 Tax=Actinomyces vulturis TaxID=1857645 RepID=UPI00082EC99A|nr:DUF4129 domain-containing protein [Actinomyces vulturis]